MNNQEDKNENTLKQYDTSKLREIACPNCNEPLVYGDEMTVNYGNDEEHIRSYSCLNCGNVYVGPAVYTDSFELNFRYNSNTLYSRNRTHEKITTNELKGSEKSLIWEDRIIQNCTRSEAVNRSPERFSEARVERNRNGINGCQTGVQRARGASETEILEKEKFSDFEVSESVSTCQKEETENKEPIHHNQRNRTKWQNLLLVGHKAFIDIGLITVLISLIATLSRLM